MHDIIAALYEMSICLTQVGNAFANRILNFFDN